MTAWSTGDRRPLLAVPAVLVLGILSGRLSGAGYGNPWFDALEKPAIMPPGWAFGLAWTTLYLLIGIALALVLKASPSRERSRAIGLFLVQLALNYAWSPVFFALHDVPLALSMIVAMLIVAAAATAMFVKVRPLAGLLMLPYLAWLCFAGLLTFEILRLNP